MSIKPQKNPKIKPPQKRVAQKKVLIKNKTVKPAEKAAEKPVEKVIDETVQTEVKTEVQQPVQKSDTVNLKPLRVGIFANYNYRADFIAYSQQILDLHKKLGDKITLVFFGHDLAEDAALGFMKQINYEYVKPVSIIHYFKQLMALELDILFIPLVNNVYNATSENYNKYLEAGILEIPILTVNVAPYSKIIVDKKNGFIMQDVGNTIESFQWLLDNRQEIVKAGKIARQNVIKEFNYSKDNVKMITSVFGVKEPEPEAEANAEQKIEPSENVTNFNGQ